MSSLDRKPVRLLSIRLDCAASGGFRRRRKGEGVRDAWPCNPDQPPFSIQYPGHDQLDGDRRRRERRFQGGQHAWAVLPHGAGRNKPRDQPSGTKNADPQNIEIQTMRLPDNLRVTWSVPESMMDVPIMKLTLQPFIETDQTRLSPERRAHQHDRDQRCDGGRLRRYGDHGQRRRDPRGKPGDSLRFPKRAAELKTCRRA